jgi:hypothetical protein
LILCNLRFIFNISSPKQILSYETPAEILLPVSTSYSNLTCKKVEDQNPAIDYIVYTNSEGLVGAGGGEITLETDNDSIEGVSLSIPEGALSNISKIRISIDNSVQPTGDQVYNMIKLEPSGLVFSKPIELKIALKEAINPKMFYFNSDSDAVEQIYIMEINDSEGYIKADINHFSYYFVTREEYATFKAELYNVSTGLKANLQFGV